MVGPVLETLVKVLISYLLGVFLVVFLVVALTLIAARQVAMAWVLFNPYIFNPLYNPASACLMIAAGVKYWPSRERVVCPDCAETLRH